MLALSLEKKTLIEELLDTQEQLTIGLEELQRSDGTWPMIHPYDSDSSVWTVTQILRALNETGVVPKHFGEALDYILKNRNIFDGLRGWARGDFPEHFSVYVTSDCTLTLMSAGKHEECMDALQSLQRVQNDDGGWGSLAGDKISKVRATVWALWALLESLRTRSLVGYVDRKVVEKAIRFLVNSQNESGDSEFGWGNLPNTPPSTSTATADCVFILLEAKKMGFHVRDDLLKNAIDKLKSLSHNLRSECYWTGVPEEFDMIIDGKFLGKFKVSALGTPIAVLALLKAADLGYIDWFDSFITKGLNYIVKHSKTYKGLKGYFVSPSSVGGDPTLWDSAYSVIALNNFKNRFTKLAGRFIRIETEKRTKLIRKRWIQIFVLMVGLNIVQFLYYNQILKQIGDWWANLPVLYQALISFLLIAAVQEVYVGLLRRLWKRVGRHQGESESKQQQP